MYSYLRRNSICGMQKFSFQGSYTYISPPFFFLFLGGRVGGEVSHFSKKALNILLHFATFYLHETGFSAEAFIRKTAIL
jgi:hypothetical protein